MRGVDAHDVAAGREQRLDARLAIAADADRRADAQAAEIVDRRGRMRLGLLDVADRDQALECPLSSTTSSFSMRCLCSSSLASRPAPLR